LPPAEPEWFRLPARLMGFFWGAGERVGRGGFLLEQIAHRARPSRCGLGP